MNARLDRPSKIVMAHGMDCTRESFWYPQVANKLRLTHHPMTVLNQTMPGEPGARLPERGPALDPAHVVTGESWNQRLTESGVDHLTLGLGHSSGTVEFLRLAEYRRIWGLILVAPHYKSGGDPREEATLLFQKEWEWTKIRDNVSHDEHDIPRIHIVMSDDDRLVGNEPREIHQFLELPESHLHVLSGKRHFARQQGGVPLTDLPEVVTIANLMIGVTPFEVAAAS